MSNIFQHLSQEIKDKVFGHHEQLGASKITYEAIAAAQRVETFSRQLHVHAGVPVFQTIKEIVDGVVTANPGIAQEEVHKFIAAKVPAIVTAIESGLPEPVRFMAEECNGALDAFVVRFADEWADKLYAKAVAKLTAAATADGPRPATSPAPVAIGFSPFGMYQVATDPNHPGNPSIDHPGTPSPAASVPATNAPTSIFPVKLPNGDVAS